MKNTIFRCYFISVFFLFSGCAIFDKNPSEALINLDTTNLKVTDKINVKVLVHNPSEHKLEYRYEVERGQIVANNTNSETATYYAPFTGGPDYLRVTIFDKTSKINSPEIKQQIFVQGETLSYADLPNEFGTGEEETHQIKVAAVRGGVMLKKDIGWGNNPTISPDGRYIAYVRYPGDGTAQIIIQDPIGNEINITDNNSFNIDPAWSPVGSDGKLSLVFSSNRNQNNIENKSYHLWKLNIDTREITQITNEDCNDFQSDWSPDGKSIVFSSDFNSVEKNYRNLYTLDISTNIRKQLTNETTANKGAYNPIWSADSQKITYSRKYKYRLLQQLYDFQKIWMIDFTRNTEGFGQIVTKNYDESIIETFPSWSPDERNITYVNNTGPENSLRSMEFRSINGLNLNLDPIRIEGDLRNITEAKWARQRSYGNGYNTDINNKFEPSTTTLY